MNILGIIAAALFVLTFVNGLEFVHLQALHKPVGFLFFVIMAAHTILEARHGAIDNSCILIILSLLLVLISGFFPKKEFIHIFASKLALAAIIWHIVRMAGLR